LQIIGKFAAERDALTWPFSGLFRMADVSFSGKE
jgi:hypothetical protein